MKKQYDGAHSVEYQGRKSGKKEFEGTWNIGGTTTGSFWLQKGKRKDHHDNFQPSVSVNSGIPGGVAMNVGISINPGITGVGMDMNAGGYSSPNVYQGYPSTSGGYPGTGVGIGVNPGAYGGYPGAGVGIGLNPGMGVSVNINVPSTGTVLFSFKFFFNFSFRFLASQRFVHSNTAAYRSDRIPE